MSKVKLTCKACGAQVEREAKPKPKNAREGRQVYFLCPSCRAVNLRDGTARLRKPQEKSQVKSQETPSSGVLPEKTQEKPQVKTQEVENDNEAKEEDVDDSFLII